MQCDTRQAMRGQQPSPVLTKGAGRTEEAWDAGEGRVEERKRKRRKMGTKGRREEKGEDDEEEMEDDVVVKE